MTGWAGPLPLHCHCLRRPHRCRHTPPSPSPPPPFCRRQSTPSRPLPSPSCRPRRLAFVAWHRRVVAGEQCRNGSVCGVGGSAVGVTVTRRAGALRGAQKLLALLGASRLVLTSRSGLLWRCATRVGPTRRHCCGSCIRAVGLFCGGHDLWSVRCRRHTGNHLRRGTRWRGVGAARRHRARGRRAVRRPVLRRVRAAEAGAMGGCTAGASLEALHAAVGFGGPSSHGQRNGRVREHRRDRPCRGALLRCRRAAA